MPNVRAGRHSREEESSLRSDLGPPWIRTFRSTPPIQVKQRVGPSVQRHLADPHQSPDIDKQIEARPAPYMWKTILDIWVLIAEDLGTVPAPLVLAQVEC